jgi:hypothetical protein
MVSSSVRIAHITCYWKFFLWAIYKSRQSYVTTDGQSVSLSWCQAPVWGPRLCLLSDSFGVVDMGRPLWLEDGSIIYNCCWSSPVQSF